MMESVLLFESETWVVSSLILREMGILHNQTEFRLELSERIS